MQKLLFNKKSHGAVSVKEDTFKMVPSNNIVRTCYAVEEDSDIYVDGELKDTAKAGDLIVMLYGIESRYEECEIVVIHNDKIADYLVREKTAKNIEEASLTESICVSCDNCN